MQTPEAMLDWLKSKPTLTALCEARPDVWRQVRDELAQLVARRDAAELKAVAERAAQAALPHERFLSGERSGRAFAAQVEQLLRQRMTELAIRQYVFSAATGVRQGKVRFNLFNGLIAQRLLFKRDFERKPVSLRWFRLVWPLLWQRRRLMPLVEQRGIYCFFSRELIAALAARLGQRPALEIAAGDGTLTRFLRDAGAMVDACDDYSWHKQLDYPDWVRRMDAVEALRTRSPEVVICCWPPANNRFERQVFRTRSVQTYIVIGSRSHFVTGNWADYEAQTLFACGEDVALSKLALPPELGAAVYVFERIRQ
ncbi:hypothetical protein [Chitinimonas sp.]|uniref:hypothetical protein n=1 Tax=Chitinimonas sp. TaxID=1934313 RepID=UPI0035AF1AEA